MGTRPPIFDGLNSIHDPLLDEAPGEHIDVVWPIVTIREDALARTLRQSSRISKAHLCRLWVGARYAAPIQVVPGAAAPTWQGEPYHWTTRGGKPIRHPNAYRWPKVYHRSTCRIVVGREWLAARRPMRDWEEAIVLYDQLHTVGGRYAVLPGWIGGSATALVVDLRTARTYHASRPKLTEWTRPVHLAAAREAIQGWQRQDAADALARQVTACLPRIWVTLEDSLAAGNCDPVSRQVAERIAAALGAPDLTSVGAVRADYLLRIRDDGYVRRAIYGAARRLGLVDQAAPSDRRAS